MSLQSTQKPSHTQPNYVGGYSQRQIVSPERMNTVISTQSTGKIPIVLTNSIPRMQQPRDVNVISVQKVLDFKTLQTSPVQCLKELSEKANSSTQQYLQRPNIQPISCQQFLQHQKTSSSRLSESSITMNFSMESINQQLERKSHKGNNTLIQKENLKSLENMQKISLLETIKEKTNYIINQLKDVEKQSSKLQPQIGLILQSALQMGQLQNQLSEQVTLWKNRCLDIEQKQQEGGSKDQEYIRLKTIMESLQSKATLLVDENSKLNQQNLSLQKQNEQLKGGVKILPQTNYFEEQCKTLKMQLDEKIHQITRCVDEKDDIVKRFTLEREIIEREKDKMSRQLYEEQILKQQTSSISTTGSERCGNGQRETSYKLEQAEVKLLSLQISNDNLKQELQHKDLDAKTIENLKDKIGILETKVQELIREKELYARENDDLQLKYGNLFQCLERTEQQVKDRLNDIQELNSYIDQKHNDLKTLQQQMFEKESNFQTFRIQLTSRIENKEQENIQLTSQLNQKISELSREKNIWENEMKRIQESLMKEIQFKESLEYDNLKLKEQLQQYTQENQKLNQLVQSLKEQVGSYNQQIDQLKHNENQIRQQIEQVQKQFRSLKNERDELENKKSNENSLLQQEIQRLNAICQNYQNELYSLKTKFNVLHREISEQKERLLYRQTQDTEISRNNQLEELSVNITEKLQQSELVSINLEHKLKQSEQNYQGALKENSFYKNELAQLDQMKKINNELIDKIKQQQQILTNLQRERDDLQWKFDHLSQDSIKRNNELNQKNEEFRIFKIKYNETIAQLDKVERKFLEKLEYEVRKEEI